MEIRAPNREASKEGKSQRILIVEDEPLIALLLQSELEGAGHRVAGPAHSLSEGMELASHEAIDVALLDVSLGRDLSISIADRLLARSIPFAFTTGYSDNLLLPEHLKSIPKLAKPYQVGNVLKLIEKLVSGSVPSAARESADRR